MKRNSYIAGGIILALLILIFWWGGNAPSLRGWSTPTPNPTVGLELPEETPQPTSAPASTPTPSPTAARQAEPTPQPTDDKDTALTCTLSIRFDTIFNNPNWMDTETLALLPANGILLEEQTVTFYEGESVFNLLVRETKRNRIHMEFENVPLYNSAYIEGIGNLYEFDCGELSGWMYKVNGWFPNYGSSRYLLQAGDRVEWVYTCDLGKDVGGESSARNGMGDYE